jgi:zinc/manganese transport system substrate-binding protein
MRTRPAALAATAAAITAALLVAGCSSASTSASSGSGGTASSSSNGSSSGSGSIVAIGVENEYANVIQQIGGKYVTAEAIESNPNTDPHTFEASPAVAREISQASLIVQNGVGYDTWANTIENADPDSSRKVIDVQQLLDLPNGTPNPHLWYKPTTMPAVAKAIATDLASISPSHASYFKANATAFVNSLSAWNQAMATFKKAHPDVPVAVTEPVSDYMLQAVGADIMTPWSLQADIMNGVDPSPQDVSIERNLFIDHKVKVFLYNQQVTDPLTESFIALAQKNDIPVVGVYETMPTPGYDYQSWMMAEVNALNKAVTSKVSTVHL